MNNAEFNAWQEYMKSRRGKWTVDQVHNGQGTQDFLCYAPRDNDSTAGVYVQIDRDGKAQAGAFEGAIPHIGDAVFMTKWQHKFTGFNEAMKRVTERLGMTFLLAVLGIDVPARIGQ